MHQLNKFQPNKFHLTENDNNYKQAFFTDAGQRVLEDLKASLKYSETLYHSNQTTEELHFLMGRQSVIIDILFILGKEQKRD